MQQQRFVALNVDEEDIVNLGTSNRVIKCVAACKKSDNGPLTTKAELEDLVGSWDGKEKALHSALDLEIRFRKCTLTKVKLVCPLFKQREFISIFLF